MAKLLKLRRGTTTQHGSFTGAEGEVTIDTTKDTAVVHDGSTAGGTPLAKENMSNVSSTNIVDRISNSALAGVKVQPNFGTQDIETTGNIDLSDSTGSGNNRIKLGTGDDLQIYHNGTRSEIINSTGDLIIQASENNNLLLRAQTGEIHFKGQHNGQTELYYDGSRKLHTRADAVNIIGDLDMTDADGYKINLGASSDLQIFHNGTHSIIADVGTGNLQIRAADFRVTNADNTELMIEADTDGPVKLYHNNSLKFQTNISGCRFVGTLAGIDNEKVALGTGNDLEIYHNGSNTFIDNSTGVTNIRGGTHKFRKLSDNEDMLILNPNAAVELYYDNSKKLHTTSGGIYVTGNIVLPDNGELKLGASGDLNLYHNSSLGNSWITNGTGVLNIRSDGFAIRAQGDSASYINITDDAEVNLYYNNSKKFETSNTGVTITGNVLPEANNTRNIGDGTTNFNSIWASNRFRGNDSVSLDLGNSIDLKIRHDGTDNLIEAPTGMDLKIMTGTGDNANETCATFDNNGAVKLYYDNSHKFSTASTGVTVSNNNDLRIQGGSWAGEYTGGIKIQPNASDSYFQYHGVLYFRRTNGASALTLTQGGDLTATGNVTAYSDARLKTNVNTINDALSIVGKLRGVSFDWKETGKPSIGVIAQEVEEVIPEVVLTNVNTDPATGETTEVKSVDYGKIVGVLINAINELKAEVDELKGGK